MSHAPVEADDPAVAQLGTHCAAAYARLEACLADNDRAWTACQKGVGVVLVYWSGRARARARDLASPRSSLLPQASRPLIAHPSTSHAEVAALRACASQSADPEKDAGGLSKRDPAPPHREPGRQ